jgi:hypothetical protein
MGGYCEANGSPEQGLSGAPEGGKDPAEHGASALARPSTREAEGSAVPLVRGERGRRIE